MTHINAFYSAVEEAKHEVSQAQVKLRAAETALAAKLKEAGVKLVDEVKAEFEDEVAEHTAPKKR